MSVAAGARLGFYEIVEQIGAGGMGDVYRARDTRLDRPVAIKIVPILASASNVRHGQSPRSIIRTSARCTT